MIFQVFSKCLKNVSSRSLSPSPRTRYLPLSPPVRRRRRHREERHRRNCLNCQPRCRCQPPTLTLRQRFFGPTPPSAGLINEKWWKLIILSFFHFFPFSCQAQSFSIFAAPGVLPSRLSCSPTGSWPRGKKNIDESRWIFEEMLRVSKRVQKSPKVPNWTH